MSVHDPSTFEVQLSPTEAASEDESGEDSLHKPQAEAFACLRLELYTIRNSDGTSAWRDLRSASRDIGKAAQRAIGDVIVHVRDRRSEGRDRMSTPDERRLLKETDVPLPTECWTDPELRAFQDIVTRAMKTTGLTEYIWSSVARRIVSSELAGSKLRALIRGDSSFPFMRNVAISLRNRNWRIFTEDVEREGKTYTNIIIETSAWRPGGGKMRLVCKSLHGRGAASKSAIISRLQAIDWDKPDAQEAEGYSKGALSIKRVCRPGQPEKWFLLVPYSAPRVAREGASSVVVVHRGVANMITMLAVAKQGQITAGDYPGSNLVKLKSQMYARRKIIQRDLSVTPHAGRGKRSHFKALTKIANAEARFTDTELWRVARAVQTFVERNHAELVLIDDFSAFQSDDPNLAPYVRRFPFAALKAKIIDACTRRAGVVVREEKAAFISQTCPACGHVAKENLKRLPSVSGHQARDGLFECVACGHQGDLDRVAPQNLFMKSEWIGTVYKKAWQKASARISKFITDAKKKGN